MSIYFVHLLLATVRKEAIVGVTLEYCNSRVPRPERTACIKTTEEHGTAIAQIKDRPLLLASVGLLNERTRNATTAGSSNDTTITAVHAGRRLRYVTWAL